MWGCRSHRDGEEAGGDIAPQADAILAQPLRDRAHDLAHVHRRTLRHARVVPCVHRADLGRERIPATQQRHPGVTTQPSQNERSQSAQPERTGPIRTDSESKSRRTDSLIRSPEGTDRRVGKRSCSPLVALGPDARRRFRIMKVDQAVRDHLKVPSAHGTEEIAEAIVAADAGGQLGVLLQLRHQPRVLCPPPARLLLGSRHHTQSPMIVPHDRTTVAEVM